MPSFIQTHFTLTSGLVPQRRATGSGHALTLTCTPDFSLAVQSWSHPALCVTALFTQLLTAQIRRVAREINCREGDPPRFHWPRGASGLLTSVQNSTPVDRAPSGPAANTAMHAASALVTTLQNRVPLAAASWSS